MLRAGWAISPSIICPDDRCDRSRRRRARGVGRESQAHTVGARGSRSRRCEWLAPDRRIPPCDVVVGPGNQYVTAAKRLVAGDVGIDLLAGPSELVVFADATADPALVAADLLAQAEHDPCALPVLVSVGTSLSAQVDKEIGQQLTDLPSADVARAALAHGGVITVETIDEGIAVCDAIAPEHLQLHLADAPAVAPRLAHYGALFIGAAAGEVLADYGIGPNHVLPTGGTARWTGGLSVLTFLRVRTWVRMIDASAAREVIEDAAWLGRAEGLEAHVLAASLRSH